MNTLVNKPTHSYVIYELCYKKKLIVLKPIIITYMSFTYDINVNRYVCSENTNVISALAQLIDDFLNQ